VGGTKDDMHEYRVISTRFTKCSEMFIYLTKWPVYIHMCNKISCSYLYLLETSGRY